MPVRFKKPELNEHQRRHKDALKLIPTDRGYFALRGIAEGEAGWNDVLGYVRKKTGRKGKINLGKVLGSLIDARLVTEETPRNYALTRRGELLLTATDDIFFGGKPPSKMATSFEGENYPVGPLTDHFKLGKSPNTLYSLIRIHEGQQKTGWASLPGLGIKPRWLSTFFRKGVLEMSFPHQETEAEVGRPQVTLGDMGQNHHFYEPKKGASSIMRLNESDINTMELKKAYTNEELVDFRNSLIDKGVSPTLAGKLNRPVDAVVLWRILNGSRFFSEIGRLHGIGNSLAARGGGRLMDNGLIERKPVGIRVKTENKGAQRVINYLLELNEIADARQPMTMEEIEEAIPKQVLRRCDIDAHNYLAGGVGIQKTKGQLANILAQAEGISTQNRTKFAEWLVRKVQVRDGL